MSESTWLRTPIEPQSVAAPLSRHAIFLTVTLGAAPATATVVRGVLADLGGLVRSVGFRDLAGHLSCVAGISSAGWGRIMDRPPPAQLRPFQEVRGSTHTAVSTPGDVLFHIRAERSHLCFEFERVLLEALGGAVTVTDETVGFRYFDSRDLLGFVDGTENPVGKSVLGWALVGDDDPDHAGGSYVVVQKYLHDLGAWNALPAERQEQIIGRRKADNVELDDASGDQKAHKTLTTITDAHGVEHSILRDNMPFGRPGHAEFGTYFIGYSRDLWVIEQMLQAMFIGNPPGFYDQMLDFSAAVTGTVFFAPANAVLESLGE